MQQLPDTVRELLSGNYGKKWVKAQLHKVNAKDKLILFVENVEDMRTICAKKDVLLVVLELVQRTVSIAGQKLTNAS